MGAGGDFRHHPAIGGMGLGLAEHDIGQDLARARARARAPPPPRFHRSWSRCPERCRGLPVMGRCFTPNRPGNAHENLGHQTSGRWQEIARPAGRTGPSGAAGAAAGAALLRRPRAGRWTMSRPSWPPAPMACAPWSAAPPGATSRSLRWARRRPRKREGRLYRRRKRRWRCQRRWPRPPAAGRQPGAVLLHVCGEDAPGTLADRLGRRGFTVRRAALYGMSGGHQLPPETQAALAGRRAGCSDVLFAPQRRVFSCELARGLPTQGLTAFCISPATAQALPPRRFRPGAMWRRGPTRPPCWRCRIGFERLAFRR